MKLCIYWPLKIFLIGSLFTIACTKDPVQPEGSISPITVTTTEPSGVSTASAVSGGTISDNGMKSISARGICWSTDKNPTISNSHTRDGSGPGTFSSRLKDLSPATTYYVRAYATNETGTFYGDEKQFSTSPVTLPAVSTTAVSGITLTSAESGGTISDAGGGNVTERGICWSTVENPTIAGSRTKDGQGSGSFSSTITGLAPATTYYLRAYAINESGTAYGNQVRFTTLSEVGNVFVSTLPVSEISRSSAKSGGSIVAINGSIISERGVCWSTSPDPTINSSRSRDGNGAGTFTSELRALNRNTVYFVRAYAVTLNGVVYGSQQQFQTRNNGNGNGGGNDDDDDEDDDDEEDDG